MIRNLAALVSLTVVLGGSFALSAQSVEGKISRNRNYLVPPPPPYTPSMVTSEPGITTAVSEKPDPYKYVFTRDTGGMRVAQPNPAVSSSPAAESKIRRSIDHFDSKISRIEKYIGKVLHL